MRSRSWLTWIHSPDKVSTLSPNNWWPRKLRKWLKNLSDISFTHCRVYNQLISYIRSEINLTMAFFRRLYFAPICAFSQMSGAIAICSLKALSSFIFANLVVEIKNFGGKKPYRYPHYEIWKSWKYRVMLHIKSKNFFQVFR